MKTNKYLVKLNAMRTEAKPIVIAGVGCGLTARAAVLGGADLIAVYSTAVYRVKGLPAALSLLPYDNANDITFSVVPEVLANAGDVPVLIGLGAHDPKTTPDRLVDKAKSFGAAGILNEPFLGVYNIELRRQLEASGFGYSKEVELIEYATKSGLINLAWVFNSAEAIRMVNAGAQMIGGMVAITEKDHPTLSHTERMEAALISIREIVDSVKDFREEVIVLGHGGPLNTPETVAKAIEQTQMDGYFTGSTGERYPVENAVSKAIAQYKKIVIHQ